MTEERKETYRIVAAMSLLLGVGGAMLVGLLSLIFLARMEPAAPAVTPTEIVAVVVSPTVSTDTPVPTVLSLPSATSTTEVTPTTAPTKTSTSLPPTATDSPPTDTVEPTDEPTDIPDPTEPPAANAVAQNQVPGAGGCVTVIGDSVAQGDAVFEVPGVGYVTARMGTVAAYIQFQYQNRGIANVTVYSRTADATGISAPNHPSFFGSPAYQQMLNDGCAYTVIVPFINDLTGGDAASQAAALGRLVGAIKERNPGGTVMVLNYYSGVPAPFAGDTFASGFTPGQVGAFNQQIAAACSGGALAREGVLCLDSNAALAGLGGGHVVGATSRADFESRLTAPLSADQGGMVNFYFDQNPNGFLVGDGVHLNAAGKAALAAFLVDRMPF